MKFQKPHFYNIQVQFEDVDMGGAVHHPNYLKFIERGRTAAMLEAGIGFDEVMKKGFAFVVAEVRAKYLKPLRYQEHCVVLTQLEALRNSSIRIHQSIHYKKPNDEQCKTKEFDKDSIVFSSELRLAMVSNELLKPCAIPDWLRNNFELPTQEDFRINPMWQRTEIQ